MNVAILRGEVPIWAPSSGYGSGDGYGYGSGDGSGYGDGDGYGYGSGDGYGYGSGDGDGYGSGDGSGYGYGYGYGYGSGYGYGDGDGSYWLATIQYFAARWSDAQRARLEELKALGAKICFWRSDSTGRAPHGGKKDFVAVPGATQIVKGPLKICTARALHATLNPPKWAGDRLWVVALKGEVVGDDEKYAALEREIVGEVTR
jgi:hypothetical protein